MWCKSYLLFALPGEISVLNLNHILRQPVKCDTLCNAAVQKTMENCFVAGMHRITMGGWDFSQTLPVQPRPALCYTEPNCCIVSGLHLSLPEVILIREITDLSSLPTSRFTLPYQHSSGVWFAVSLLTQSSQRDAEHLLILLTSWDSKTFVTSGNYKTVGKPLKRKHWMQYISLLHLC